jgi:hypothetical protein
MGELTIPKSPVDVEVLLAGGQSRRVTLFLADSTLNRPGRERLIDLLTSREQFIPARDLETETMTFLNTGEMKAVWVDRSAEDPEPPVGKPTEHTIQVDFVDGGNLKGVVSYVLPEDHSRLFDFLRAPSTYFKLFTGDRVALINKHLVARVAIIQT